MFTQSQDVYAYIVYIEIMTSLPGVEPSIGFCDSKFFWILGFRGFDGLSSISGSKVMAK